MKSECPYCKHNNAIEDYYDIPEDTPFEVECGACGKYFWATWYTIHTTGKSEKAPCLNGGGHVLQDVHDGLYGNYKECMCGYTEGKMSEADATQKYLRELEKVKDSSEIFFAKDTPPSEDKKVSNTGFGVLLNMLGGSDDTIAALRHAVGKTIKSVEVTDTILKIRYENRDSGVAGIDIYDGGQSCCESRYMTCDDDLVSFVGDQIVNFEIADADDRGGESTVHEIRFLKVSTNNGVFTIANHNEHNGYYGGFSINAELVTEPCEEDE